jgi:hypothetical protein
MLLVSFLGGWLIRTLFDRIKDLETADQRTAEALSNLRVELPSRYTAKDDFHKLGDSIFEALRRIEDKIDRKADKPTKDN